MVVPSGRVGRLITRNPARLEVMLRHAPRGWLGCNWSVASARMSIADEHVEAAQAAGLRYVTDSSPGIRRRRRGRGFAYVRPDGDPLRDAGELERIRKLVIPPRWTDVWICPSSSGHLQVTARDARGRKQYRYHTRYREVRDLTKFGRMVEFSHVLPGIRRRVERDISQAEPVAREGARHRGVAARDDAHSRRQRRVCARQRVLSD